MTDPFTCLEPHCSAPPAVRGLCRNCHSRRCTQIKNGKTTWAELESAGLAKRSRRRSRPCVTPGCLGHRKARGLCDACYSRAKKAVFEERTTWAALERLGHALPVQAKYIKGSACSVEALPKKLEYNTRKPRVYQANGDGTYSVREWEQQYFARLDAYLKTPIGSPEARRALDLYLNE